MGIGGEYSAVNSAIDELIPAKYRGRIDLIVNGSFWVGAAAGAAVTPLLLDQSLFSVNVGWRLGFGIGGVLGLSILLLRRFVPESPRWLVTHCRAEEANRTVRDIERDVASSSGANLPRPEGSLTVHPRKSFGLGTIFASMLGEYRARSALALRSDGGAIVSLQFGILQLWPDPVPLLSRAGTAHWLLSTAAGARQFLRTVVPGRVV